MRDEGAERPFPGRGCRYSRQPGARFAPKGDEPALPEACGLRCGLWCRQKAVAGGGGINVHPDEVTTGVVPEGASERGARNVDCGENSLGQQIPVGDAGSIVVSAHDLAGCVDIVGLYVCRSRNIVPLAQT